MSLLLRNRAMIGLQGFNLLSLSPKLWLESTQGITLVSGKVSQWDDLSGNNNHAIQPNSTIRPSIVAGGVNFLLAVLYGNYVASANWPTSAYVVMKKTFSVEGGTLFGTTSSITQSPNRRFEIYSQQVTTQFYRGDGSATFQQLSLSYEVGTAMNIQSLRMDQNTIYCQVNEVALSFLGSQTSAQNYYLIGSRNGTAFQVGRDFTVYEVIALPYLTDSSQHSKIINYLKNKYSISF